MIDDRVFIALDVEAAGDCLGLSPTISIGACVVTREDFGPFATHEQWGKTFYTELKIKADPCGVDSEAMRVGCSELKCLETLRKHPFFDTSNEAFNPTLVIKVLQELGEDPAAALKRFNAWLARVAGGRMIVGVTDAMPFDAAHVGLLFGLQGYRSPFGWKGYHLPSMYEGHTGNQASRIKELVPDTREKPHRADHDAHYLAQLTRELFFNRLHW